MDCLPALHEWSSRTRWEFIKEHLEALRWHLEQLEAEVEKGPHAVISERQHLQEICQRGVETHTLLEQLARLPLDELQELN
ncbi:hypothetical protein COW36_12640 [bacterium (Candidatus Blackallbacteria) CG17_big_fil_post_rev_8_21_14_2_50_48_46]|uniref:Uncharacterized protein n=1 Tax=bacterium (Candidatus Blackallbacteria) CG17_big_fil_post_rev_8_21_14_2_50_48_46 TaxID=2014261 RepID=A0A2M7G3Z5_9BACT|nr:MAG: hypothetical protein COW64_02620 [bacterium (Candidatus Blackallbacteria) CG18_big_fil_WC_8_21_14_2_50_49_26]PIW16608.1 MAG: hypothetical protein COW36_12640 [bacterium (Candidatus Blackallbacteria) CG17_big_fil_post_rev_8_21_14_2_50_48_46]PIW46116.1 MAG: hypothetical protein COW20_17905 [bacterium (Candidatus Blackallbacteria) CG13_big_fil_rev_8_21_14_2_50_49_14]